MKSNRRLIEQILPVKEISSEARREKNIRHGNPSSMHVWWARRPLSSSRVTCYASLVPASESTKDHESKRQFLVELSKWENTVNDRVIEQAKQEILKANKGVPPKVLDPFGGGGSIPLEALRLGCEVYSNDLNPVAVFIQKCTLEFFQKYSTPEDDFENQQVMVSSRSEIIEEDIENWASWLVKEAENEVGQFYPSDTEGRFPVAYIWARVIPCQDPSCQIAIPLFRQYWLSTKKGKSVALYPSIRKGEVAFSLVGSEHNKIPSDFEPTEATVNRAVVTCPACGSTIDAPTTRSLFEKGESSERLIAIATKRGKRSGIEYRVATAADLQILTDITNIYTSKVEAFVKKHGIDPIPAESLPPQGTLGFRIQRYGFSKWLDLFNKRQKLAIVSFMEKIPSAYKKMIEQGVPKDYSKAIVSYLALVVSKFLSTNNTLCRWKTQTESIVAKPDQSPKMEMRWDYPEANPFSGVSGSFNNSLTSLLGVLSKGTLDTRPITSITQSSATSLPYPNNFFDAVFTDPPYYDNFPYSHLSDFFYVWLQKMIGELYPELFSTPLTPKAKEIVAYPSTQGADANKIFEASLKESFREIYRVLKSDGLMVVVYAHKSTEGWESLVNSLIGSRFVISASWPIDTERESRQRAQKSAALASSIYIVARKGRRKSTGFYRDVRKELEDHLSSKLKMLWSENIGGADFLVAAIGSAIEVFSKYENVLDFEGRTIQTDRLLDDVREIATNYAVKQILHNGFSREVSGITRFYVLYRWNYGVTRVKFDEARKLAQSCGISLTEHISSSSSFIRKEKEFIKLLGPQARRNQDLDGSAEMIDVLHQSLRLWEKGKRNQIAELLSMSGYDRKEAFWRVAQAISETLPLQDKEKKLLDGFCAGKNGYNGNDQYIQETLE